MNSAIRLAIFIPSMRAGGAELVAVNLAQELSLRGYSVDLLLAQAEGPHLSAVPESVRLIAFNVPRVVWSLPALVRYLKREQPRAVLSVMANANIVMLWAHRLAGVSTRAVVSEHVSLSWRAQFPRRKRNWLLPWLIRRFYPWSDGIIAVSEGVAAELSEVAGILRERIRTIYNPVITPGLLAKAKAPLYHPWFKPEEPPVVLAAGRLTAQKGFPSLIEAFAQVRKRRLARLLILGEGDDRSVLEALVRKLSLEQDVSLPGYTENPYAYMARAALFVLSSRWEGLPTVLIEALYFGVPIVATDCLTGPKEILKNGQYGQLVPVEDIGALARAIETALITSANAPPRTKESWQAFELGAVVDQYIDMLIAS